CGNSHHAHVGSAERAPTAHERRETQRRESSVIALEANDQDRPMTMPLRPALMIEFRDAVESADDTDTTDPTESTDAAEPIEPIDATEPIEPSDITDPRHP